MTEPPGSGRPPDPMVLGFPQAGPRINQAYRDLFVAVNGNAAQKVLLGNLGALARPWDPATWRDPDLRMQLWEWLDQVVIWLNHQYTWDAAGFVPACWPHHPHLVHELAVLADQRRRAGFALTSDALEDWHRLGLPTFIERMRTRLRAHCEDTHAPWPGRPRYNDHVSTTVSERRERTYAADIDSLPTDLEPYRARGRPRLGVVDLDTGLVVDHRDYDLDDLFDGLDEGLEHRSENTQQPDAGPHLDADWPND